MSRDAPATAHRVNFVPTVVECSHCRTRSYTPSTEVASRMCLHRFDFGPQLAQCVCRVGGAFTQTRSWAQHNVSLPCFETASAMPPIPVRWSCYYLLACVTES